MLTAFSWGYDGWGSSIPQLIQSFTAAEAQRGFGPPVFVDIRARRAVRAIGFQKSAFEKSVGSDRYRWMNGLGNEAVRTGRGKKRLVQPAQVYELLGLILSEAAKKCRVIFFCSCHSPLLADICHRRLVTKSLVSAARRLRVKLSVEEWPGGTPSTKPVVIRVPAETIDAVRGGATGVKVPESMAMKHAALPHGQVVAFTDGKRRQFVACNTPIYRAGRWSVPVYLQVEPNDSARMLQRESRRHRAEDGLS